MSEVFGHDCFAPREIAERVENVGVTKANLPFLSTATLGVLAGAFIGLGAMFCTVVFSDESLGFAVSRILGGFVFSLGLILVIVAGAELFTGNNLLVMAYVARRISGRLLVRNLGILFVTNFVGAFGLAVMVKLSGHANLAGGAIGRTAVSIAFAKSVLPFSEAFMRGVVCNILVCLAVWLAMAGRSVTDKVLAIVFPITAFVAGGFEHSIANMYFIPLGIILQPEYVADGAHMVTWGGFVNNLVPVALGNLVGGAGFVGLVYHLIYRHGRELDPPKLP